MTEHPSEFDLRDASLGLQLASMSATAASAIASAARLERYYQTAIAVGVSTERAEELLREAQGRAAAGSTPIFEELDHAQRLVIEEAMGL